MTIAAGQIQRVFQSRAETKAFYNKISRFYDFLADRSKAPMRHAGLDRLNAQPGEKILEIGFGTGHSLISLAHAVGPTARSMASTCPRRCANSPRRTCTRPG